MTSVTITDHAGELVERIDYLQRDRLTNKMFKSIENSLSLCLDPFFGYKLPLNINIHTTCSNINLYADRLVFGDDVYYTILRMPIGLQLDHVRFRKMSH